MVKREHRFRGRQFSITDTVIVLYVLAEVIFQISFRNPDHPHRPPHHPEDVLPVVRMLLLHNTNINGQVLVVDGAAST